MAPVDSALTNLEPLPRRQPDWPSLGYMHSIKGHETSCSYLNTIIWTGDSFLKSVPRWETEGDLLCSYKFLFDHVNLSLKKKKKSTVHVAY